MYSRVMALVPPSRRLLRVSGDRPETNACSMSRSWGRKGRSVTEVPDDGLERLGQVVWMRRIPKKRRILVGRSHLASLRRARVGEGLARLVEVAAARRP